MEKTSENIETQPLSEPQTQQAIKRLKRKIRSTGGNYTKSGERSPYLERKLPI